MSDLSATATRRWLRLSPRERIAVGLAAIVVLVAVLWAALWRPLSRDLDATERALLEARTGLAQAQARANDIAALSRRGISPAISTPDAAVLRTLAARGLRESAQSIDARDGAIRVTFTAIGLEALIAWLEQIGREERLFPAEMTLTRRVEPGRVRAEVTLAR